MYHSILDPLKKMSVPVNSKRGLEILRRYVRESIDQRGGQMGDIIIRSKMDTARPGILSYNSHLHRNMSSGYGRSLTAEPLFQHSPRGPTIIVSVGLPGSGRLLAFTQSARMMGLNPSDFFEVGLDKYIENDEYYKQRLAAILTPNSNYEVNIIKEVEALFSTEKSTQLRSALLEAYNVSRKALGCPNLSGYAGCEQVSSNLLIQGLKNKKHVHIESSGLKLSGLFWFLKHPEIAHYIVAHQYKIVFAFSLCSMKQLISRNTARARRETGHFLKQVKELTPIFAPKAPRYSFLRYSHSSLQLVIDVLLKIISKMGEEKVKTSNYSNRDSLSPFNKIPLISTSDSQSQSQGYSSNRKLIACSVLVFDNTSSKESIKCIFDTKHFQMEQLQQFLQQISPQFANAYYPSYTKTS